jgi:hypothetical protein
LARAVRGVFAYYLVHSLHRGDFVTRDRRAAQIVAREALRAGVSRIVYLGGIVPAGPRLSRHLASRAEVGELDMMRRYAAVAGLPRRVVVPVLTPWLSAQWVNLVTPVPRSIAVPLVESLVHETSRTTYPLPRAD